jgi:glycosyltransferase involved in cell wall biosynthesis
LGGGTALQSAKDLARELGITRTVSFSGWINMEDAVHYTQFADIAVCYQPDTPTVRAASNMKVFQYMAMGSVPVVSDVGDLAHYVRDGAAGVVVTPENPDALAKAICELLHDKNHRIRLAAASRKLAETTYAWSALATRLSHFLAKKPAAHSWGQRGRAS